MCFQRPTLPTWSRRIEQRVLGPRNAHVWAGMQWNFEQNATQECEMRGLECTGQPPNVNCADVAEFRLWTGHGSGSCGVADILANICARPY